jgi:hypothetical protein
MINNIQSYRVLFIYKRAVAVKPTVEFGVAGGVLPCWPAFLGSERRGAQLEGGDYSPSNSFTDIYGVLLLFSC